MKQKVVNKVYIVSVINNDNKVVDIIMGKILQDIKFLINLKYPNHKSEIMTYNDVYNLYVPDIREQLMLIRRMRARNSLL